MQIEHNLTEGDEFTTAAGCSATVINTDGETVEMKVFGESENEYYEWDNSTVAEYLINETLVPWDGGAVDYLNA
jgi:preprotein translocase subunit YajC